jgi:putative transposase
VPKVARLLLEAEPDLLAFSAFPAAHHAKAALHQPAGAGQPRDRPAHRGGGVFPNDQASWVWPGAC